MAIITTTTINRIDGSAAWICGGLLTGKTRRLPRDGGSFLRQGRRISRNIGRAHPFKRHRCILPRSCARLVGPFRRAFCWQPIGGLFVWVSGNNATACALRWCARPSPASATFQQTARRFIPRGGGFPFYILCCGFQLPKTAIGLSFTACGYPRSAPGSGVNTTD